MRYAVVFVALLQAGFAYATDWSYAPNAFEAAKLAEMRAFVVKAKMNVGYPGCFLSPTNETLFRRGAKQQCVRDESDFPAPCLKGRGWEALGIDGVWRPCDVWKGSEEIPPHRRTRVLWPKTPFCEGGRYDAGRETVGYVTCKAERKPVLFAGESLFELANEDSAAFEQNLEMEKTSDGSWRTVIPIAFRYFRFKGEVSEVGILVDEECPPLCGRFNTDDARLRQVWQTAVRTLRLCMRTFLVDGVKRDRLPWSGDLAVSLLANAYTFREPDYVKHTLNILGSVGPERGDINGIVDYSCWWVICHDLFQRHFGGDSDYLASRWQTIRARLDSFERRADADGMIGPEGSILLVDWGDTQQPTTALNILQYAALTAGVHLAERLGEKTDAARWQRRAELVRASVRRLAMDGKSGLFRPNLRRVDLPFRRHANFLAVVYDVVDPAEYGPIADALAADALPSVGTPYMMTFEAWALAKAGRKDAFLKKIEKNWGDMLDLGATTFWEASHPGIREDWIYGFYGRKCGLSLCHAWGAGPAFLLPMFLGEGPAKPPLMGWSSWNAFHLDISEDVIKRQAQALCDTGLAAAGYRSVNIDDGYFGGGRDASGRMLVHPKRFPNGLKPVVDFIHGKGLKAGIYSDAGRNTCGHFWANDTMGEGVGLYGHDRDDAVMFFRDYGFDFIKVDYCGGAPETNVDRLDLDRESRYSDIAEAIRRVERNDVTYNICCWDFPGTWAARVADSWRTTVDIGPNWGSVKTLIKQNLFLSAYAGGGHYNDMDMLELGQGVLSEEEEKTHFATWCMLSSPLLIGCDVTKIPASTLAILRNPELIAVNQDPLGLQGYLAKSEGACHVLIKDARCRFGCERYVLLVNLGDKPCDISLSPSELDLGGEVVLRDLFLQKDLGRMESSLVMTLLPHGSKIYLARGACRMETACYRADRAYLSRYQEIFPYAQMKTAAYEPDETMKPSNAWKVVCLGKSASNDVRWKDVYSEKGGRYRLAFRCLSGKPRSFEVFVNGVRVTTLTAHTDRHGWRTFGVVSCEATLEAGANEIRLFNATEWMPDISQMMVTPVSSVSDAD